MKDNMTYGFATTLIHAGGDVDGSYGALATPIYASSTFVFDSAEQGGSRFNLSEPGYIYSRLGNPTTNALEAKIAAIEQGEAALALSSGMGAISTAIYSVVQAKDHILADETLYGCTYAFLHHGLSRFQIEVTFVDFTNPDEIARNLRENTKVVYFETPANPNLKIIDIEMVTSMVHNYNKDIVVMCDNTFATPYLQQPLLLGCDVSLHSATKYLNGHGDVVAGLIVGRKAFIDQCRLFGLKDMTGAVMSAFDAYLIQRGMKTLEIRMRKHSDNALEVARYLESRSCIKTVYYPGLEGFNGHGVAKKQMRNGNGGVLSFELNATFEKGMAFINAVRLCKIAVSLGDCETLIQHPASMTHSPYTKEEREKAHISDGLIRMSIGLEDANDIIADLEQAFQKVLGC